MLLIPGHEVRNKSRETWAQSVIGEDNDSNLHETEHRADDLAIVTGKEELDSLDQIRQDLWAQLLVELKKES